MAKTIINTALTETYLTGPDEEVVVARSGSVITDDDNGIFNGTAGYPEMNLRVNGTVHGLWTGIVSAGRDETLDGARTFIKVGKFGQVSSDAIAINVTQDTYGADVIINGTVRGEGTGVMLETPGSFLKISGNVSGKYTGIILFQNDSDVLGGPYHVINHGSISSEEGSAVWLQFSSATIKNFGSFTAPSGVTISSFDELNIINTGTIFASDGSGIDLSGGLGLAALNNSGVIHATEHAIQSVLADLRVVNSGTISGDHGFLFGVTGDAVIRNSGAIAGESRLIYDYGYDGTRDIVNHGLMSGDIEAGTAEATYNLVNHGTFAGNIRFGRGDDVYKLAQTGTMTGTVHGGLGNDTLIGNDSADRLSGAEDDDRLDGRGGDDVLDGGQGDDRLQGGTGADVFVFGAQSGRDRVTDFDDGSDILRLVGHAGGFDGLTISDRNGNLLVEHDNGVIVLVGEAGLALTAADFDFVIV